MHAKREAKVGPLTIEEFEKLPEEDEYRVELVRGWIVREPRPAARHGRVLAKLTSWMEQHVDAAKLGYLFVDIGVIVTTQPRTVRGPDLAFVRAGRMPAGPPPRGFLGFVPDLCIEVVSPSNRTAEIREKVLEYLEAGATEVWVADPETAVFTIYGPGGSSIPFSGEDDVTGSQVVPEFRLSLHALFGNW